MSDQSPARVIRVSRVGTQGIVGASTYELARLNGFVGTLEEWLAREDENVQATADNLAEVVEKADEVAGNLSLAQTYKTQTETARDVSLAAGPIYLTESAGRAAVANGVQFRWLATDGLTVNWSQRVDASTSTFQFALPTSVVTNMLRVGSTPRPTSQGADPDPFIGQTIDITGKVLADRDPVTGYLNDTLTPVSAQRLGRSLGLDSFDRSLPASQGADPAPFADAISDNTGKALLVVDQAGKVDFEASAALLSRLGLSLYVSPSVVPNYGGSAVLARKGTGYLTLETWNGYAHAAYNRDLYRMLASTVNMWAFLYGGQSQGGPAGGAWTKEPLAETLVWMLNGQANQISGQSQLNHLAQTALIPGRDPDSVGGHAPSTLLAVALAAQMAGNGETVPGFAAFSSYYGGQPIEAFRQDGGGITPNFWWPNNRGASEKLLTLAQDWDRKAFLAIYPFAQGENATPNWEATASQVFDDETAAQAASNLAISGITWRPPVFFLQTDAAASATNDTGVATEQLSLARKHVTGTTTMASKAMILPAYMFTKKNNDITHYDPRGNFMRAETMAWIVRRHMRTGLIVPPLDRESISYTEGSTTLRLYLTNPTFEAADTGAAPSKNTVEHPGNPIFAERDWIGKWALPPNEGFALEGSGGVTITSVTPGGFGNNWIDFTLSGALPNLGNGTRKLIYGYTPTIVPTDSQPVNWSSMRGTICVDTGTPSWFRRKFRDRMGAYVIPEFVRLYLVRFKETF